MVGYLRGEFWCFISISGRRIELKFFRLRRLKLRQGYFRSNVVEYHCYRLADFDLCPRAVDDVADEFDSSVGAVDGDMGNDVGRSG